ncbi:MAG: hypothetical protein WDO15_17925 [Bacteroidota bacterium]
MRFLTTKYPTVGVIPMVLTGMCGSVRVTSGDSRTECCRFTEPADHKASFARLSVDNDRCDNKNGEGEK